MDLQQVINKASTQFVTDVMEAIRSVPLSELLGVRPDVAPTVAKRRGRPPKKAAAKSTKKIAPKVRVAQKNKKHAYPKCSVSGCKNTMWARGEGMCGVHFKAAQVKPPVVKKAKKMKVPRAAKLKKALAPKKESKVKMAPMGKDAAIAKAAAATT